MSMRLSIMFTEVIQWCSHQLTIFGPQTFPSKNSWLRHYSDEIGFSMGWVFWRDSSSNFFRKFLTKLRDWLKFLSKNCYKSETKSWQILTNSQNLFKLQWDFQNPEMLFFCECQFAELYIFGTHASLSMILTLFPLHSLILHCFWCVFFFFSSPTKACIVASIIFVLDKKTDLISAPHALVYFGIVIFFVYFKVCLC